MEEKQNDQKEYDVHIKLLVYLAIGAVIACIVFFWMVYMLIGEWKDRGLFGDMFGALNALFSGLAFAGVIYAILLQKKELSLQREEMKLSREELAQQNQIISEQLRTMHETYKFQQEKERWESEPVIKCVGGQSSIQQTNLNLTNYGGRITQLKAKIIDPQDNYKIEVQSGDVLDKGGQCGLIIKGDCKVMDLIIELSYITRMETPSSKLFKKPKGLHSLIPL